VRTGHWWTGRRARTGMRSASWSGAIRIVSLTLLPSRSESRGRPRCCARGLLQGFCLPAKLQRRVQLHNLDSPNRRQSGDRLPSTKATGRSDRIRRSPCPARGRGAGLAAPDDPEAVLGARQVRSLLARAIQSLPPAHRAALILREIEGLSYEAIAKTVGCSLGTVMSRLFYARRKLQKALQSNLDDLRGVLG